MSPLVKIPRALLRQALDDLERPHPFAGERLGFFSFRQSMNDGPPILMCYDYHPILDNHYIPDYTCGARIGGDAIRTAMGRSFREQAGQLWVHTHGRHGRPIASTTDISEGPKVVQSILNAQPKTVQAWCVVSEEGICGEATARDGSVYALSALSVVGWPMEIALTQKESPHTNHIRRFFSKSRKRSAHHERQSFLGPNALRIIENAKIGIVGLGGGGSHINQQLAHIGFQRIVLCDPDRIERTNLNRLVGATLQDVRRKRYKVVIASRLFKKLQPDSKVEDIPGCWEDKRDALRECDLVFGCLDSFSARRDLEAFCRSLMIPLIDIGMGVFRFEDGSHPEINGQVIVSMPGESCMHCLQYLTQENLAAEVQDYDAGPQAQVVWSNGVLGSTAVGYAMALLTGWSGNAMPNCRLDYRGSALALCGSNLASALKGCQCRHYPLSKAGDPIFKQL